MGKIPVLLGCMHSHGGFVVSGDPGLQVNGVPGSFLGARVTCPDHGPGFVVRGSSNTSSKGLGLALDGFMTSCGAYLIPRASSLISD